jgi:transposase
MISGSGSKTFCQAKRAMQAEQPQTIASLLMRCSGWHVLAVTGVNCRKVEPAPAKAGGKWNSVFQRYNRWSSKGVWESLFKALADDPDFEFVMMDATIVRAHQHSAGAKGGDQETEAIGRSRGGLTTKLHALCDALGNPVRLILTPGNIADCTQAEPLLKNINTDNVLADKGGACPGLRAGDSDAIVELITASGASAVIPPKANRLVQRLCDFALYCERNLVERFFNKACTGEGRYQTLSSCSNTICKAWQKLYGLRDTRIRHALDQVNVNRT